jgi:hypothetical protein
MNNTTKKVKRLIYDIETSPCIGTFWRPGYKINISHDNIIQESAVMCVCYKWEGEKKIHSIEWNKGDDFDLCKSFIEVASQADELIAHNGDRFDLPIVKARCIKHDLDPTPLFVTVDTLKIARNKFRFNSNRLDYLGKFLLNEGKIHTSFDLWKDILLDNCEVAMKKMIKYCKKDVELLERVWKKLEPYAKPKTHAASFSGGNKWMSPFTGSQNVVKKSTRYSPAGTIRHQMRCKDTGGYYMISNAEYVKYREWRDSN